MRFLSLLSALPLLALASCYQFEVTAQGGYALMGLDGDLGYATAGNGPAVTQSVESFGLGDDQGTPYARAVFDMGVPVFSVSGFMFDEEGDGQLQQDFGDVSAGIGVHTDFELTNLKAAYAFKIAIGPVALSPGLAVDYFDLHVDVRDVFNTQQETVDVSGPVPLAFLRGELNLWKLGLIAEAGYMKADLEDADAQVLDLEALLELRLTPLINVFAGYRLVDLEIDGEIDGDAFDADVSLGGFLLGGGLRF